MKQQVAERKLLYSIKNSDIRKEFTIRIFAPYQVREDMVDFPIGNGLFGCHVEIDGLNEDYSEVYGADAVQAINIASNLESFLKRMQTKYDLFWTSGDPYFE